MELNLSEDSLSQEIDLEDWIGVSMKGEESLLLAIGQAVVDRMRERTEGHRDNRGEGFASYSKSYKNSDAFEAYGKTNKVDMTLTGSMLASIDFSTSGSGKIKVFIEGDEAPRAFGHMTGMEGHKFLDGKVPVRAFFGMTQAEFKDKVLPLFEDEIEEIREERKSTIGSRYDEEEGFWSSALSELFK